MLYTSLGKWTNGQMDEWLYGFMDKWLFAPPHFAPFSVLSLITTSPHTYYIAVYIRGSYLLGMHINIYLFLARGYKVWNDHINSSYEADNRDNS